MPRFLAAGETSPPGTSLPMKLLPGLRVAAALVLPLPLTAFAADDGLTILPASPSTLAVTDAGGNLFQIDYIVWGPNWGWTAWEGKVSSEQGVTHQHLTAKLATGATLTLETTVRLDGQNQLVIQDELSTDLSTDLTLAGMGLTPDATRFAGGKLVLTKADGSPAETSTPQGFRAAAGGLQTLAYATAGGTAVTVGLEPPAKASVEGGTRLWLAADHLDAGKTVRQTVTVTLPGKAVYYPTAADMPAEPGIEKWYAFHPEAAGPGADELSLAAWLDAPAGKQGRITGHGPGLFYGGRPIRLWGLNNTYGGCAPGKDAADARAGFYARHGINAVRLHKYADGPGWEGIQSADSCARFDPAGLDRMDYYVAKLKERGIYVELSPVFMMKLGAADRAAVPYMDELGSLPAGDGARVGTEHGVIYLSSELQDLLITQMTTLLAHRNPYTGLTYAEDPAVACIELFNEDSALFYGTMSALKVPTLRARTGQRFTRWLKARYGSKEAFLAAWGDQALNRFVSEGFTGEDWDQETILPLGDPWFYAPEQLAGSMAPRRQRLLDTMRFLYEVQNTFYDRYLQALHQAGYAGETVASNWIAGSGFSHFYNLASDAHAGIVDRHNYFEGIDDSMLARPGSGILSSGLSQVADRPFMLSEWVSTYPNQYAAECAAIIGAYGMGLQGWDASFIFEGGDPATYLSTLGGATWEVATPAILGLFPAVSREVLRGDVQTADLAATRYVCVPALEKGVLGFDDRATQNNDVKTSDSTTVPAETLAVARTVVEFTPQEHATQPFDPAKFLRDGAYDSATGQLRWHPAAAGGTRGWFTVDTPATQAVVGFAGGQHFDLHDVAVDPATPFAAIYLTAQERDRTLADSHAVLVSALARVRNTGMKIVSGHLLERGAAPVLVEPVAATLTFKRGGTPTVYLLDHAGHRTGVTLPVTDGKVTLDGARDRTPYYLVVW